MKKYLAVIMTVLMSLSVNAAEQKIDLSPELRALLVEEMNAIKKGMESLVFLVASGDWHRIEETARNIEQTYIMKNRLTEHQRHELHQKLPHSFIEVDKKFHYYAGMLSHVAKEHDSELVNFYIYKMNESCVACHSKFVSDKFTGFQQKNRHEEHNH